MSGFKGSFNHRAIVTFYRHGGDPIELTATAGEGALAPHVGGPASLVAASTNKGLGGGMAGTFSLTLKRGSLNILKEIKPGDWIILRFQRNGKELQGTLGVIVDVREARTASSETYTISGQDFGRVIDRTEVWFDDYTDYQSNAGGKLIGGRMGFNPVGSPDQLVQRIINAFLGSDTIIGGSWKWPRGLDYLGSFFSAGLKVSIGNRPPVPLAVRPVGNLGDAGILRGSGADEFSLFQPNPGTTLTQQIQRWTNPILNELFFDVADGQVFGGAVAETSGALAQDLLSKSGFSPVRDFNPARSLANEPIDSTPAKPYPTMFMREKPFVNLQDGAESPWFKLPTVLLHGDEIKDSDLGTSDEERLNLFMIYANGTGMSHLDQYAAYSPGYSRSSMGKYGLRKFEQETVFCDLAGRQGGRGWLNEMAGWSKLITDWYALNHELLSGTITTPVLLAEARIGKRLIVEGEHRRQFYIEGVSQNMRFPQGAATTLRVTRGFEGEDAEFVEHLGEEVEGFRRSSRNGVLGYKDEAPPTTKGLFHPPTNFTAVGLDPKRDL